MRLNLPARFQESFYKWIKEKPRESSLSSFYKLIPSFFHSSPSINFPVSHQRIARFVGKRSPLFLGFTASFFLQPEASPVYCKTNDRLENPKGELPSEIPGFSRKELQERKENLFRYLYNENYEPHYEKNNVGITIKARAFQELLDIGQEAVEKIKDKEICIVLGMGGAGKSLFVSYLAGNKILKERNEKKKYDHFTVDQESATYPSPLIRERTSGTISPFIAEIEGQLFVDMPGIHDTRGELITIANGFILEKIINEAKSTSFVITVDTHSLEASRSEHWADSFQGILDSLSFNQDTLKDFHIGDEGSNKRTPMRILVNDVKNKSNEPFTTKDAQTFLDDEREDSIFQNIHHLGFAYDPMCPQNRTKILKELSNLKKMKLYVKIHSNPKQLSACIDDLDALKNHLDQSLKNLPQNCSILHFRKVFEKELLPSMNYCDRLTDFSSRGTIDKYHAIKKEFEEILIIKMTQWLNDTLETNNKEGAEQICDLIMEIQKNTDLSPNVSKKIVELMSPITVKKINRNYSGSLSLIGAMGVFYATNPLFGILGFIALNTLKIDQHLVQFIGGSTSLLEEYCFNASKLDHFTSPLKKFTQNISNLEKKILEIRNERRGSIVNLLNSIEETLDREKNEATEKMRLLKETSIEYRKREVSYYEKMTDLYAMDKANKRFTHNIGFRKETEDLDALITLFIHLGTELLKEKNSPETFKTLKMLRIVHDKINVENMSYIQRKELNVSIKNIQNAQNRFVSSWTEDGFRWLQSQLTALIADQFFGLDLQK